ncbi:hypothetical protein O9929_10895 [Vibrio lentus]|nr:hypothetical protein [Vibrio lentus]
MAAPDYLNEEQRIGDTCLELGEWLDTEANIIKLQTSLHLYLALSNDQRTGARLLPNYPEEANTDGR